VKLIKILVILIILTPLLFVPQKILAQENPVLNVGGYSSSRNRYPLILDNGGPPDQFLSTSQIYALLKNVSNFGLNGVSQCKISLDPLVNSVEPLSLVDQDGNLVQDVFFAGVSYGDPSLVEIAELKRFLEAGGVLYINGSSFDDVPWYGKGYEYNILFSALGLRDSFSDEWVYEGEILQSTLPEILTPLTSGPFGEVESIGYDARYIFNKVDSNGVFKEPNADRYLVSEVNVGRGYLVIAAGPFYTNARINDPDNKKYYLNMFAYACEQKYSPPISEPDVLLDVPLFTQTNPLWGNFVYDTGNKQSLWCGNTIGHCGCALTSAAMLLSYHGINIGPSEAQIDPAYLNQLFAANEADLGGYFRSDGFYSGNLIWSSISRFTSLANITNPDQTKLDYPKVENYSLENLKLYLNAGLPVVLKVFNNFGATHWVLAKGYIGDEIIVNDPLTSNPEEGYLTLSQLNYIPQPTRSMLVYEPTNSDYSSVQVFTRASDMVEFEGSEYYFDPSYVAPDGEGVNVWRLLKPDGTYQINPTNGANYSILATSKQGDSYWADISSNEAFEFEYDSDLSNPLYYKAEIDIRPEMKHNFINLRSNNSVVRVALFSDQFLDATGLDSGDVEWEGADVITLGKRKPKALATKRDVNKDGLDDVVYYFRVSDTGIKNEQTEACLLANYNNLPIRACDVIRTIPR